VLTVLVTGASGSLGSRLLVRSGAARHRLRALARRVPSVPSGVVDWRRADLATGDGLDDALHGVDVVLHAASAPRGDTVGVDVEGTARLVSAAERAGVRHLLYVSIVGVDRVPFDYYRHKLAAESIVTEGAVPWTIQRGTQFHDFMDVLLGQLSRLPVAVVPAGFLAQPIDVDEFADLLWDRVAADAAGRAPDAGGPQVLTWRAMMRALLQARRSRRPVLPLPIPGALAAAMRRGDATAPEHAIGRLPWSEWVQGRYGGRPHGRTG
jgi:uncharacterized protein YbjT (DUF2867 family)